MNTTGPDSSRQLVAAQRTFGALLRQYRLAVGLSQGALAERAGMSVQGLSALENGKRQAPYRHTVSLLAQALGLSAAETAALEAAVPRGRLPAGSAQLAPAVASAAPDQVGAAAVKSAPAADPLPTGTLTFLLTDVEGSTPLWEQQPAAMQAAIARHDELLGVMLARHGGRQVKERGEGDNILAVFTSPSAALAAACALQQALLAEPWPAQTPMRVRVGLHTGEANLRGIGYHGVTVNRAARIRSLAHGGQVLLSRTTAELVRSVLPTGVSLRSLGAHQLKGLNQPEEIYQMVHPRLPADFPPLTSPQAHPSNLPIALTSFIGREREQDEVRALLGAARMVTLTGAGGAGKTRLALAVAEARLGEYPDGVWLVELAPLADRALVIQAVAQPLRLREEAGQPLLDALLAYLKERQLLLVLDNCEHLVGACAELATALLRYCPHLRILATSREGLEVAGERLYRVPSLAAPSLDRLPSPEELSEYAAVALFVARAQERRADFALTAQNARAVAAARVGGLPVEAIAARLDDRFKLLTTGPRTALARQQTLRSALDWSYDLLGEPERRLLQRLAAFGAGGCTLAAAEAVCGGSGIEAERPGGSDDLPYIGKWEVLDLLAGLVNKSLVLLEEADPAWEQGRYRLLETVREYGLERLEAAGEVAMVRDRHFAWYLALVEEAEPRLRGPEQGIWLARLEREHDNLRAALRWTLERGEAERGLRLAGALWRFWYVRGHVREGRQWLDELLAMERSGQVRASPAARAKALNGAGVLATIQDDFEQATALYEQSLALQRDLGDRQGIAACLNNLGNVAIDQGDYERAAILLEDSLALRREMDDPWAIANCLNNLGRVADCQGNYTWAAQLYEESLTLLQAVGDTGGTARTLSNLASTMAKQGDYNRAVARYEQSLRLNESLDDTQGIARGLSNLAHAVRYLGDEARARALYARSLSLHLRIGDKMGMATCLDGMAGLVVAPRPEQAASLFGAAAALRATIGVALSPDEQAAVDRDLAGARGALAASTFAAAWFAGQSMSLEQAIDSVER
jgi:predicted ATPase/class 3 adenylate cyclase/DNA-binding XRE family transcriptional regulator